MKRVPLNPIMFSLTCTRPMNLAPKVTDSTENILFGAMLDVGSTGIFGFHLNRQKKGERENKKNQRPMVVTRSGKDTSPTFDRINQFFVVPEETENDVVWHDQGPHSTKLAVQVLAWLGVFAVLGFGIWFVGSSIWVDAWNGFEMNWKEKVPHSVYVYHSAYGEFLTNQIERFHKLSLETVQKRWNYQDVCSVEMETKNFEVYYRFKRRIEYDTVRVLCGYNTRGCNHAEMCEEFARARVESEGVEVKSLVNVQCSQDPRNSTECLENEYLKLI